MLLRKKTIIVFIIAILLIALIISIPVIISSINKARINNLKNEYQKYIDNNYTDVVIYTMSQSFNDLSWHCICYHQNNPERKFALSMDKEGNVYEENGNYYE